MNKNGHWHYLPGQGRKTLIFIFFFFLEREREWWGGGIFVTEKEPFKRKDSSCGVDNLFPNGSGSNRYQLVPCFPLQETPSRHLETAPTWESGNPNPLSSPLYRNPASLGG